MKLMNFKKLNIINPLIRAISEEGFGKPTESQSRIISKIFSKKDIFGCIENDRERTSSFAIPIIQQLKKVTVDYRNIRVLIITANSESALKIDKTFNTLCKYLPISKLLILDNESPGTQKFHIRKGREILIATPERLLDLIQQGHTDFSKLETLIIKDIMALEKNKVLSQTDTIIEKLPTKIQKIIFTSKLTAKVQEFATRVLSNPSEIKIPTEFSVRKEGLLPTLSLPFNMGLLSQDVVYPKTGRY